MKGSRRIGGRGLCMIAACLAALVFVLIIFTFDNIDPVSTQWVTGGGGDNLQHYLGWRFFRNSSWSRHFLFMKDLNYPAGTSVIVTDSNPLYCLIFKVFTEVLPESFQFNGISILMSYLLLAVFSVLAAWQLTGSVLFTLVGALIALLNPVILQRSLIHDTLTSHYLIMAAIWLFLNYDRKWNLIGWFILTEITLLTHIYFIPMIAFILLLQIIRMLRKKVSAVRVVLLPLVFAFSLVLGYYGWGYSYILPQSGSFGELSMNLNAFINPDGTSAILRDRPALPLQYEGYNYWGLGLLLMAGVGLFAAGRDLRNRLPYLIPVLLLCAVAASNIGYFDTMMIYSVPLPEKIYSLLSVFRSSGRLAWPLYYLVLFVSLKDISVHSKHRNILLGLTVLCVVLQAVDLTPLMKMAAERFRNPGTLLPELPADLVQSVPGDAAHLFAAGEDGNMIDSLALFASDQHMTFNKIASAREIRPIFGEAEIDLFYMECSQVIPNSVYIYLDPSVSPEQLNSCSSLSWQTGDGWTMFLSQ